MAGVAKNPAKQAAAFFDQNRFAEAVVYFRRCRDLNPEHVSRFAEALINLGLLNEALKVLSESTLARHLMLKGLAYLDQENFELALENLKAATEAEPGSVDFQMEFAMGLAAAGNDKAAEEIFLQVKNQHPEFIQTLFDRANGFFGMKLFNKAAGCLKRVEKIAPNDPDVFYRLGLGYMDLNLANEAEAALKKAIRWRPSLENYRELATVYEKSNQIDKALLFCKAPLSSAPNHPYLNAVVAKCELRKGNAGQALERLTPFLGAYEEPEIKAEVFNTLGRIHHKLGNNDEAYGAFVKANEAVKEQEIFSTLDLDYPYKNTKNWIKIVEKDFKGPSPESRSLPNRPKGLVFFVGFPRSGTTLVQTLLESHQNIKTIDERPVLRSVIRYLEESGLDYPFSQEILTEGQLQDLREIYFLEARNFVEYDETTTLVDKLPLGTLHLPLILTLFPTAKIIFAVRHPNACTLSCLMQNFSLNNAMGNLTGLDEITRFYDLVMGFWVTLEKNLGFQKHIIKYESLVEEFEIEARSLIKFLELNWDDDVLEYQNTAKEKGIISTPSYSQVVRPIYREALESWKNYENFFKPYQTRLDPYLKYFGYSG